MKPLKLAIDSDRLVAGRDFSAQDLQQCSVIIWRNYGVYGVISQELVADMRRHVDNIAAHPRIHRGTLEGLMFHFEQTEELTDYDLRF